MSKTKESSGPVYTGRTDGTDNLSSYVQMKSPILGAVEFDASIPEIPVDACLLSYKPDVSVIDYSPSAVELTERLTAFQEFDRGLHIPALDGLCYAGVGIEDHDVLSQLEDEFRSLKSPGLGARLAELRMNMMRTPEMLLMQPIIGKACEGLPDIVNSTLFDDEEDNHIAPMESDDISVDRAESQPLENGEVATDKWDKMSVHERVNHHVSRINDTFVSPTTLQHPRRTNAKIARHYKIMPNVGLWKNRYIQASIEGVTNADNADYAGNLEVGSLLNVAKDEGTQRIFEYYVQADDEAKGDMQNEPNAQERFCFVRVYSCQKSATALGNDNYFLLSIPASLHNEVKAKIAGGDNFHSEGRMEIDEQNEDDVSESVAHILSLKGQKLVLHRAGKARRPDIMLTYTDDESPQ